MDLVSGTPRTDAIAERFGVGPLDPNDAVEQYNDLLDLARQLERERSELLRFAQAAAMYGEGAALQDMATALLEKLGEPLFADLDAAPQECPPKGDEGAADKVHPPAVAAPYQPNYRCANCLVVSAQWLSCQKADCPHRNVGLTIAR